MSTLKTNIIRFENALIVICFVVMTLCSFAQVINRNFIGAGISWFDELSRYSMVYLTILATEVGLRDGTQISISAFTDKMPPFLKRIIQIIVKILIISFSVLIVYSTINLTAMQYRSGQVSAAMGIPMWIPYLSLPIGFLVISIVQFLSMIILLKSPLASKDIVKE